MTTSITPAVAENLRQTDHNRASAREAVQRIRALGWEPLGPYPGSDTLWHVKCLLCKWDGMRFYSHLGRNRPLKRHGGRECVPQLERPYYGLPIRRTDPVLYPFSTHERAAAWLALRKEPEDDPRFASMWRTGLRIDHRSYRRRVLAVGTDERDVIQRARLRGISLPSGTHDEVMTDLKDDGLNEWVTVPYGLALVAQE